MDGSLSGRFPALHLLRITHQALRAMALLDPGPLVAALVGGCSALKVLVLSPNLCESALHQSEQLREGGALLARLVTRLPDLESLFLEAPNGAFFNVRACRCRCRATATTCTR